MHFIYYLFRNPQEKNKLEAFIGHWPVLACIYLFNTGFFLFVNVKQFFCPITSQTHDRFVT